MSTLQSIINNYEFFILLLLINFLFVYFIDKISNYISIFDKPDNIRKNHSVEAALLGGFLIAINFSIFIIYFYLFSINEIGNEKFLSNYREIYSFYITSMLIFIIGVYDDKFQLKPNTKFILIAILLFIAILLDKRLILDYLYLDFIDRVVYTYDFALFFSVLCFLLFINALNMFDGINLQVGFYSIVILLYFLLIGVESMLILTLIISLLFFLYLNYKNISFLGDGGSLLIAYILSFIFIRSYNDNLITDVDTIFVIMMIPGIDMFRLFCTRILTGKNAFSADANHIHHIFYRKFKEKTFWIIQLFISLPIIFYFLFIKSVWVIIFTILTYFACILILTKKGPKTL